MKRAIAFGLLLVAAMSAIAQTPASAEALLNSAKRTASKSGRVVFVKFTASWCGWCHKMQGVLDSSAVKPVWDKYFVTQPIVVLENGDKKALENAGGQALMEAQGGKDQGIPFFFFIDPKSGKTIVNSMIPASGGAKSANLGCPYAPEEVAYFMTLLSKAAPKMSSSERNVIESAFRALSKNG